MYSEDTTLKKVKISELLINLHFIQVSLQLIRKFSNMNTINKCMMNLDCKRHHKFALFFMIFSPIKYGLRFFPISEIRVRNMRKSYPRQGRELIYIIFYRCTNFSTVSCMGTFTTLNNSVSLSRYVNEVSMDSYNTTSPSRKRYRNSSISFAHFVTANINAIVNDQLFSLTCFLKFVTSSSKLTQY